MIGRNEPCPCGSGKKYKKCCLQKNKSITFSRNKTSYAKGLYKNTENKIYRYIRQANLQNEKKKCQSQFYVSQQRNSIINNQFKTYFVYDYKDDKGRTIISKFIESNKSAMNRDQKNILNSMMKSSISIFKIDDIGSIRAKIRNYFDDTKLIIEDIDSFEDLQNGDSFIGRFINIQGMNIFIDSCVKIPKYNIDSIIANVQSLYNDKFNEFDNINDFVRCNSELIYKFAQKILLNQEIQEYKHQNKETKVEKNNNLDIGSLLENNIEDKYLQKGLELWKKFKSSNCNIKGSESGWAAAIEYYIKKDAGEIITQVQVSQKYEVSPRTLGKRYKELKVS